MSAAGNLQQVQPIPRLPSFSQLVVQESEEHKVRVALARHNARMAQRQSVLGVAQDVGQGVSLGMSDATATPQGIVSNEQDPEDFNDAPQGYWRNLESHCEKMAKLKESAAESRANNKGQYADANKM